MTYVSNHNLVHRGHRGLPEKAPGIIFNGEAIESNAESPFGVVGGSKSALNAKIWYFCIFFTFFRLFEPFSFVFFGVSQVQLLALPLRVFGLCHGSWVSFLFFYRGGRRRLSCPPIECCVPLVRELGIWPLTRVIPRVGARKTLVSLP